MRSNYTVGGSKDQPYPDDDDISEIAALNEFAGFLDIKPFRPPIIREKRPIDPTGLTPMAAAMIDDLVKRRVVVHRAGTASGKTHSAASAAIATVRAGHKVLLAFPTLIDCDRVTRLLKEMAPALFDGGQVAEVFGRRVITDTEVELFEDDGGGFPITTETALIVCTHAQLMRRNWSCYIGGPAGGDPAAIREG